MWFKKYNYYILIINSRQRGCSAWSRRCAAGAAYDLWLGDAVPHSNTEFVRLIEIGRQPGVRHAAILLCEFQPEKANEMEEGNLALESEVLAFRQDD